MIVKSLLIENIYSLKGKHYIDFQSIGRHTNLLAITGKTGAGKSTILNAISLALYGKTHLKALVKEDYITLGEKKGRIELHFEVNGKSYTAFWSVTAKGSQTRRFQTPQELKTTKVSEEIEKVIKLNFDQFTKTVILNQGEFANFITSSFAQRKDILEELVNIQNLKYLSKQIRSEIKNIEIENKNIFSKLEATSIISKEQVNELENSTRENRDALKKLQEKQARLEFIKNTYQIIYRNGQKLIDNRKNTSEYNQKISSLTSQQNSLKADYQEFEKEQQKFCDQYELVKPNIVKAYEIEAQRNITLSKIKDQNSSLTKTQQRLQKREEDKKRWDKELSTLKAAVKKQKEELSIDQSPREIPLIQKCLQLVQQANTYQKTVKTLQAQIEDKKKYIDKIKQQVETLEKEQEDLNKSCHNINYQQLEKDLHTVEQQVIQLEIEKERSQQIQKQIQQIIIKQEEISEQLKEIKHSRHLESQNLLLLEQQKELLKEKQHTERLQNAIKLIEEENKNSTHCLVCQSELPPVVEKVNEIHPLHDTHDKKIEQILEQITRAQEKLHYLEKEEKQLLLKLKDQEVELNKLKSHQKYDSEHFFQLDSEKKQLKVKLESFQIAQSTLARIKLDIEKLKNQLQEISEEADQLIAIEQEQRTLYQQVKQLITEQIHFSSAQIEEQLEQIISYLQQTERYLQLMTSLKSQRDEVETLAKDIIESKELIQKLEQKVKECGEKITELIEGQDDISEYEKAWDLRITNGKNTLNQKQNSIDQLEMERRELSGRIELLQRQDSLIHQDTSDHFENEKLKEFQQLENPPKALQFIQKIKEMIKNPTETELKELKFLIEDLLDGPLGGLEAEIDSLKSTISKQEERLAIQREQESKLEQLSKQIDQLQKVLTPKKDLEMIIGNDDFRNYLLSLVESQLITLSNMELESLCQGRYRLYHHENEYYISDGHKGAELRKISTLSGGEKFMVSLSMALGLAEMTRGETEIDSFFIDEGFGTLDEESLDEIVTVLQNVQSRGKFVTIITHVQDLSRRLPVNLHVKKQQLGNSIIETIYN